MFRKAIEFSFVVKTKLFFLDGTTPYVLTYSKKKTFSHQCSDDNEGNKNPAASYLLLISLLLRYTFGHISWTIIDDHQIAQLMK